MTELEFLELQEKIATQRLQRALLGGDGTEAPLLALEQAARRRPWVAVGAAAAIGGLLCVSLRSATIRRMLAGPMRGALLGTRKERTAL